MILLEGSNSVFGVCECWYKGKISEHSLCKARLEMGTFFKIQRGN